MDSVEKSFTLEPRQVQRAIATGSFEITELFDQSITKKPSRAVNFSTVGLSTTLLHWKQNAGQKVTRFSDRTIRCLFTPSLRTLCSPREAPYFLGVCGGGETA
jgi:hypothetical protein